VWVLAQMRAMVETQALERLEQRLEELAPSNPVATRTQISRLAQRIEAIGQVEAPVHYVAVAANETEEEAKARYEQRLGAALRGTVYLIRTGVPRAPDRRW